MTLVRQPNERILYRKAGPGGCNYSPDVSVGDSIGDVPMCPQPAMYVMAATRPVHPGDRFYVCVDHAAWARATDPDMIGWIQDIGGA